MTDIAYSDTLVFFYRNGFVLDPNGEIFHLNNNKVIVKDIKNASGLAIDTEKHKLYWSSASG